MMSSAFGIVRKLYVMAPIWTPLIFESIAANADSGTRASAQDAGRAVSASFPNSRRERSIPRLLHHVEVTWRGRCYIKALGDRVGLFVPERDERVDARGTARG